jgi:cell division transport system permease protein
MLNTLFRRAFVDMKQSWVAQLMTILVVSLSLLIIAFFSLLSYNLQNFVDKFGSELGVVVYLKKDTPQTRIPELYQNLAEIKGVRLVQYVSPEDAFKRLAGYLEGEKEVLEGVDPLFLPASFELYISRAIFNLPKIRSLVAEVQQWKDVSQVQYGQEWINRLEIFSESSKVIIFAGSCLLFFTVAFVVSNTIKLSVFARQDELEILSLVGATSLFIQGPFIIVAVIQGFAGSLFAICTTFFCYMYFHNLFYASEIFKEIPFVFLPWHYILGMIVSSVLLCVMGTYFSTRRFVRL